LGQEIPSGVWKGGGVGVADGFGDVGVGLFEGEPVVALLVVLLWPGVDVAFPAELVVPADAVPVGSSVVPADADSEAVAPGSELPAVSLLSSGLGVLSGDGMMVAAGSLPPQAARNRENRRIRVRIWRIVFFMAAPPLEK